MGKKCFYYCTVCGNIIEKIHDSGNDVTCCMKTMVELEPGTTDGKAEFHVPVCKQEGNKVKICIGQEPHPMTEEHHIEWVQIVTNKGVGRQYLKPGDKPEACFHLCEDEKICEIYAYCNLHKLWKAKCSKSC